MMRIISAAAVLVASLGAALATEIPAQPPFRPTPAYSQLSVGAASSRVALPSGTTIVVYNTGPNPAFVALGNSTVAATSSGDVIQPNSWMAFTAGSATWLAAIETAGTTALNISGGSGLPTGAGGGGGGSGGGGAVTAADGAIVTMGTEADSAWSSGNGTLIAIAKTIASGVSGPIAAGSATIGKVDLLGAAGATLDTAAGTSATQAIGVQGVTGGIPQPVSGTFWQTTQPVSGTFWQATQPVSLASLPALAVGSNTIGKVDLLGNAGATLDTAAGTSATQAIGVQGVTGGIPQPVSGTFWQATQPVSGTFWQTTQPVSLASLPALAVGSNTIGAVTQAGGPWGQNITQIAGSAAGVTTWGVAPTGASVVNANVNCLSGCGGSGGTSASDNSTFTAGTTSFTPIGGEVGAAALTTGHTGAVAMDAGRNMFANVNEWAGVAITNTPTAVGVAGTGNTPTFNSYIVGCTGSGAPCNANGQATMPASSPVVIASDQSAVATKAASGAFVAGAVADLAHGQGTMAASVPIAIASDQSAVAVKAASGAFVAGAVADLAHGQGTMAASVPIAIASDQSAVATKAASGAFVAGAVADLAHGQATMVASVPIAIASDQSAVATKAASGAFASGAFATGAIADLALAQGSTTSGEVGNLPLTATTSAHPAYTAAKSNPLSTNLNGQLRSEGPTDVTPTDCSVTLTTGGTAQNAFAAQTTLHGFTIANTDNTSGSGEPIWFSFTTTAAANTAGSYPLAPATATTYGSLASYTTPPGFATNHALSVVAATTGHKISCTWW